MEHITMTQKTSNPGAPSAGAVDLEKNGAKSGANSASSASRRATGDRDVILQAPSTDAGKPTVSHMLGEVTWLLSQSATHKHFMIADLEWLVMPAILLEQFRVFHGPQNPLGFAVWAELSEEAETRFKTQVEAGRGARLAPSDWKSGDRLWLVELVAPFATPENKLQEAMLSDLVQNVFGERRFKLHLIDPKTGKREEKEVEAAKSN